MSWINYLVDGLYASGTAGIIPAESLEKRILEHDGGEAYHCAFHLWDPALRVEEFLGMEDLPDGKRKRKVRYHAQTPETLQRFPKTTAQYRGPMRASFGRAWFDFDSSDGGETAFTHAKSFFSTFRLTPGAVICFSGSKGFHVGIPLACTGLTEDEHLGEHLNRLAHSLKASYPSLDTTIYNANRKFRALGSQHPKTKLFKIALNWEELAVDLSTLRDLAKLRRPPFSFEAIPEGLQISPLFDELRRKQSDLLNDSVSLKEARTYRKTDGAIALEECLFLKHAADDARTLSEPEWYATASLVSRFENGRKKFHEISRPHPAYTKEEADDKFDQAARATGPRTCEGIQKLWTGCSECSHFNKIKTPVQLVSRDVIASEISGFYFVEVTAAGKLSRTPDYEGLVRAYERDAPYRMVPEVKTVYRFHDTHYSPEHAIQVKAFTERVMDPRPKETLRVEFLNKIQVNRVTNRDFFEYSTRNRMNFKNGVLQLSDMQLVPHSPEYGFRFVLPYDYDPTARCTSFLAWLNDVLCGDAELISVMQEWLGYVVRGGEYEFHKIMWLSGSGRNGKSTLMEIMTRLVGFDATSFVGIDALVRDKFAPADLDGKILNLSEETSPQAFSETGIVKHLSGGGQIAAQKKYGDTFYFSNRAKLVVSYNEIPQLKDFSTGMLSRIIVIPFEKVISEEEMDPRLGQKLAQELSGICAWAFEGWKRLERRGQFTRAVKSQEALSELRQESDSVYQWFRTHVRVGATGRRYTTSEMYEHYKATCQNHPVNTYHFGRRLLNIPELRKLFRRTTQNNGYDGIELIERNDRSIRDF